MAVNDVEIQVGQVWRTRRGQHARITANIHGSDVFSFVGVVDGQGKTYTAEGRTSLSGVSDYDLVRFVCLEDGRAPAIKFVGQDKPDDKGWVKWNGGNCPLMPTQPVIAKLRDGSVAYEGDACAAIDLDWSLADRPWDIDSYKVMPLHTITSRAIRDKLAQGDGGATTFVPGYEKLAEVMRKAYDQAARGKGAERHANGLPFHEQPMLAICRNLGSIDGMLYQASKKAMEARGLPTRERAMAEIYGAINYLAGAAILIEEGIIEGQK